jgi:hypothetical protein
MSEDTLAHRQAMMQRAATDDNQHLQHAASMPAPASMQAQQQLNLQHAYSAGYGPQHKAHMTHAQHTMQQVQQAQHAAGMWCAGPMMRPQMPETAQQGPAGMHGSPAHAGQHMHSSAQLQLPAAYSRLSIAGDTVADAQRQNDQCLAPAAAAGGSHQATAWAMMQRAAAGQHAAQGPWPGAGPDVDAAKLRAQADQRMQGQALSVEVGTCTSTVTCALAAQQVSMSRVEGLAPVGHVCAPAVLRHPYNCNIYKVRR